MREAPDGEPRGSSVDRSTPDVMSAERSVEFALRIVGQTSKQIDAVVEQSPSRAELACASGCRFCCYHPVDLTVPEALAIVTDLRTSLTSEALNAVRQRVVDTAAKVRTLSYEAHAQARIPCALLVDNVCAVYPSRPFACRAWHSKSVDRCQAIFTQGDPVSMIPPLDLDLYESVWSLARGAANSLKQARLDGRSYELHSLMSCLLTAPETVASWLRGEDAFATCTVGAFTE